MTPGVDLKPSVVSGSNDTSDGVESTLVLCSGSVMSPTLVLLTSTQSGAQDMHVQGLHYEVKLAR
jgi:hypothetical protein